jgi:hypothetical protein
LGRPQSAGTTALAPTAPAPEYSRELDRTEDGVTPEQRRLRARIAANARWSRAMARPDQANAARSAMIARLERQVDPAGALAPDEKAVLVRAAARRLGAELNAAKARKRASAA